MRVFRMLLISFLLLMLTLNNAECATRLNNVFDVKGLGYTVSYPENWIYEFPDKHIVIFSGPKNSDEWYTTVNIQNLLSKTAGGRYDNLQSVYQDYRNQFATVNATIHHEKKYYYTKDGLNLPGFELRVEYKKNNETYKQWIIVIQRNDKIFHQFSYTAPVNLYDSKVIIASAMLDTWKLRIEN